MISVKFKDVIKFFKKYFKEEKGLIIKAFFLILISSLTGVLIGYLAGLAIDKVAISSYNKAIFIFIIILIMNLFDTFLINKMAKKYYSKAICNMNEILSCKLYNKIGLLPAIAFEEKTSGELINRIINDTSNITSIIINSLYDIVSLISTLIIYIFIWCHSIIIAIEVTLYIIVFYLISKHYLPIIKKNHEKLHKYRDNLTSNINESVHGIREIRALGIRKSNREFINQLCHKTVVHNYNKKLTDIDYNAYVWMITSILEAIVYITTILLIIKGNVTFAFFMTLTNYIYRFINPIEQLETLASNYQELRVSIERVDEILENKIYEDITFGNLSKMDIVGNIEFKNVTFRYKEDENYILSNFNLKLETNKKIAIVGKSGQGKTTIFNLLLRYFEPNQGVILIDDIPINDFDEESFNQNIAIIRQDPFIFNKSLLENFRIINPNLSLVKIRRACKRAEIDDYIMSLPKKYDTIIGEGGINLSGGQKQRVAIARALLKNSKIILLDEATSALDNDYEDKIKKVMDELVKDHTIVIIAHRLSTIVDADIINVVDNGQVVDSGTHKELLKKNNLYKELYKKEK